MKLEFLSKFSRDIDSIHKKSTRSALLKLILEIEAADRLEAIRNLKKLAGHKSAYRIRVGDYRLGFFHEEGKIILARFVHRKDIYKLFP